MPYRVARDKTQKPGRQCKFRHQNAAKTCSRCKFWMYRGLIYLKASRFRRLVASLCAMQQKSLKVSTEVHSDLKAYADARGGLPLGRAIETLLDTERQRQSTVVVTTQVPDEQCWLENEDTVGLMDAKEHPATLEAPRPMIQPEKDRRDDRAWSSKAPSGEREHPGDWSWQVPSHPEQRRAVELVIALPRSMPIRTLYSVDPAPFPDPFVEHADTILSTFTAPRR